MGVFVPDSSIWPMDDKLNSVALCGGASLLYGTGLRGRSTGDALGALAAPSPFIPMRDDVDIFFRHNFVLSLVAGVMPRVTGHLLTSQAFLPRKRRKFAEPYDFCSNVHFPGKMSALVSNDDTDGFDDEDDACPLSGEDLQAARSAMDDPTFIDRLMGTVIYRAKKMGLWSPHAGAVVGEHDAIGIAVMCVDKCISGRRRWNRTACPSFYTFCCGQVRSILGNEARKAQRNLVDFVSPIPSTGPEGESIEPPVPATEPGALFAAIATRSGIELGDRFLTDFALALPENSIEQRIIMLVLDDRTCASRARCMELLRIPADQYEAAVKRIVRQLRDFTPAWVKTNKISPDDWREAT